MPKNTQVNILNFNRLPIQGMLLSPRDMGETDVRFLEIPFKSRVRTYLCPLPVTLYFARAQLLTEEGNKNFPSLVPFKHLTELSGNCLGLGAGCRSHPALIP